MELLTYLLKASAGMVALYSVYWLWLRKHTYFAFNRFYLLTALLISFAAPWVVLPESAPESLPVVSLALEPTAMVFEPAAVEPPPISVEEILPLLYLLGVLVMVIRLGFHLWSLLCIVFAGQRERLGKHTIVRLADENVSSFSFLNYLVVSKKDADSYGDVVLRHELVHIQQRHSWDLLWVELIHAIVWWNPILIFYKRSLKEIHEYIADEEATNGDRLTYARTLAGYAFGVSPQVLTNNFFDISQLKNRIAMLTKNRSSRWVLGRYLLALPVVVGLTVLVAARSAEPHALTFGQPAREITIKGRVITADGKGLPGANIMVVNTNSGTTTDANGHYTIKVLQGKRLAISFVGFKMQVVEAFYPDLITTLYPQPTQLNEVTVFDYEVTRMTSITDQKQSIEVPLVPPTPDAKKEKVWVVVEQNSEFPGGVNELQRFLSKNIKYPAAASRANVQGKVFVRFVVGQDGQVRDASILKGLGFGCDDEALRLMRIMPKWKPAIQNGKNVAMQYNLPIAFVLEKRMEGVTQEVDLKEIEVKRKETSKDGGFVLWNNNNITTNDNRVESRKLITTNLGESVLYFVDDKEVSDENPKVNPDDIESISVLKGEKAILAYGDKGKDGVIFITTKDYAYAKTKKTSMPKDALYIIDGKEVSIELAEAINPDRIERIDVLKGEPATKKYGEKAKSGVVEMILKKKN